MGRRPITGISAPSSRRLAPCFSYKSVSQLRILECVDPRVFSAKVRLRAATLGPLRLLCSCMASNGGLESVLIGQPFCISGARFRENSHAYTDICYDRSAFLQACGEDSFTCTGRRKIWRGIQTIRALLQAPKVSYADGTSKPWHLRRSRSFGR